ncbi:MAG: heme NO-binding domain-containing protein [Chlamydiales bacterium]|nr:heme NO-binding domain-containing protein [Chlamydiia bacterium]MCP5507893.1 heme NO-binding domain-containing protein [Chlamydiales bacterium]
MFGTALKCLQDFVLDNYGKEKWNQVLDQAGLSTNKMYHSIRFYPDAEFEQLIDVCAKDLRINKNTLLRDFGKIFGEHLISMYGGMFLKDWKSLDIIEKVAPKVFITIQFVDPYTPKSKVKCERVSPDEVVIHYQSPRKMCIYLFGIIDAVAEHFQEKLEITETGCMHQGDPECVIHVKRKAILWSS